MTRVIALTGSIGMGKSTVAAQLKQLGARVVDADAIVHQLLAPKGKAFEAVARAFPEVEMPPKHIDRKRLGAIVFADPTARKTLEAILHPLVRQEIFAAMRQAQLQRWPLLVLEIPLLFETGYDRVFGRVFPLPLGERVNEERDSASQKGEGTLKSLTNPSPRFANARDTRWRILPSPPRGEGLGRALILTASAPAFLQRQRVLKRPGMTPEKLAQILATQLPDRTKRQRSDAVILTGLGKAESLRQLRKVTKKAPLF